MATFPVVAARTANIWSFQKLSRCYSVFPKSYAQPVYKREEQEGLKGTEEGEVLAHSNVKPAFSSDTCSEFHDYTLKKFINYVMREGKKQVARNQVERAFEIIKRKQVERYHKSDPSEREAIELDPKEIFYKAVENCTPVLQLQPIRKGGITYQVPVPVTEGRAQFLSMNWLIQAAKEKDEKEFQFCEKLAKQILNAFYNEGAVIKKKQELYKKCEANRAYAHFRWQ